MSTLPAPEHAPGSVRVRIEGAIEESLFAVRWLLAPLYVGLTLGLVALLVKFVQSCHHLLTTMTHISPLDVTLEILELVDITLVANLLILVMFVGYENFVSKLDAAEGDDRPQWLGFVDYAGLKLKLIGSLVAISGIQLLSDLLAGTVGALVGWRIALHVTLAATGLMYAVTERVDWHRGPNEGASENEGTE
jgi:uncharacterized protein (TIGR00645 family)